jgi:Tol biopolymer transport system component
MALRPSVGLLTAVLIAGVTAGCGNDSASPDAAAPLRLAALRTVPGNPPQRSFVVLRADGTRQRTLPVRLPAGLRPVAVVPERDDTRVFAAGTLSASDGRRGDIYSFGLDGSQRRRLTATGDSGAPAPAADGSRVAYVRSPDANGEAARIWIMDGDGGHKRQLVPGDRTLIDFPGSWAPDGDRLAFTRCHLPRFYGSHDFEDRCAVYVIRDDGSGLKKLADSALEPDWSPDGKRIAFVSMRDHTGFVTADEDTDRYAGELYAMDANGSHQQRVTTTLRLDESSPRWSPGGTRIGFVRRGQAFTTRLFQINADGTCATAITHGRGDTSYNLPSWLPTGGSHEEPLRCS